jgi:hypothetical protein
MAGIGHQCQRMCSDSEQDLNYNIDGIQRDADRERPTK